MEDRQRPSPAFARWMTIAVLLALVLVVVGGQSLRFRDSVERDAFEWWAEIVLPSIMGAATVLISAVALISSSRATRLASEVDKQRVEAESARAREESLRYLRGMAVGEARTLAAWAFTLLDDPNAEKRTLAEVGPDKHVPTLRRRVVVELGQSLVPGAHEIYAITKMELENHRNFLPYAGWMPDAVVPVGTHGDPHSQALSVDVANFRRRRMLGRIRDWAHDPQAKTPLIIDEIASATESLADHMDYRQGLWWQNLKPLSELPYPEGDLTERRAFLAERGLIDASQIHPSEASTDVPPSHL
ncbi:hypothetical protein [Microbacterium thalli]|uniref:hypothetical protein n=1 Tax=Microbacterium thalli TaxID=3027921 RepID=UPI00236535B1|nr:hypothetical protein [Microbacterium thalli]MDD7930090.1 hypothetical protein [Microbacterium thalli]